MNIADDEKVYIQGSAAQYSNFTKHDNPYADNVVLKWAWLAGFMEAQTMTNEEDEK